MSILIAVSGSIALFQGIYPIKKIISHINVSEIIVLT